MIQSRKWARLRDKFGPITVVSVHHSGTNLVYDNILRAFRPRAPGPYWQNNMPHGKLRIHCEGRFIERLRLFIKYPVVVPMRHPAAVMASWKARGKPVNALLMQYELLKGLIDPAEPFYVPIDTPDRDRYLEQLSQLAGKHIHSRWPVVSSCGKVADLNTNEHKMVDSVMADGFFEPFYGSR